MGIEGIEHLKGDTMEDEPQSQQPVEGQQDESASPPPEQVTPPTPAHEEADRAAGRDPDPVGQAQAESTQSADVPQEAPTSEDDVAPDADEPGDDTLDPELQQHVHDGDVPQDEVDQEG